MKILITRNVEKKESPLKNWCNQHHCELIFQSFIEVEPVLNLTIPETDWVFFSSPKGAELFLSQNEIKASKIAALSTGTAEVLLKKGYQVDFIGEKGKSTLQIATAFNLLLTTKDWVLFPLSNRSVKSIQSALPKGNKIELITYRTNPVKRVIPDETKVIIVSSPSNGEGLKLSGLKDKTTIKLIAWGETTLNFLKREFPRHESVKMKEFTEEGILPLLSQVLR